MTAVGIVVGLLGDIDRSGHFFEVDSPERATNYCDNSRPRRRPVIRTCDVLRKLNGPRPRRLNRAGRSADRATHWLRHVLKIRMK
jgi:hypothetical protein